MPYSTGVSNPLSTVPGIVFKMTVLRQVMHCRTSRDEDSMWRWVQVFFFYFVTGWVEDICGRR